MTFIVPVSVITSSDDGNKGEGSIDGKDETRWSAKGKGQNIIFNFEKTVNIDKIDIKFYKGNERQDIYDIYFKAGVDDFKLFQQISGSGKSLDWQTFDVDGFVNVTAIKIVGQNDGWNSLVDVRFLVAGDVCNCCKVPCECCECDDKPEPKPDPKPEPKPEPKPDPKPEPTGKEMKIDYPAPKISGDKGEDVKAVLPNDDKLSKQNKGIKHSEKLPLLAKKDKYGEQYTDIPALCKLAKLDLKVVAGQCGVKDYSFEGERFDPYENNNSGGVSKRLDMKGAFLPQFEYQVLLRNKSNDKGDESSLKYGGPHSDSINYQADCLIVQIKNDGKSAVTQTEPSHMDDKEEYGYGDKFNKVDLDLPQLAGNEYTLRFIKLNDLPNQRVIIFAAIKIPSAEKFKDWTLIYETQVYGGFDGNRGLKDPFRQWVGSAMGKEESASITIRADEQPKTKIKKGEFYDNARLTTIVDYS